MQIIPAKQPPKRRSQAIKIINPDSGRNVLDDLTKGSEEAKKEEANVSFDLSRRDDTAAYNTLQIMTQLSTFLTFFLLLKQAFCFAAKEKLNFKLGTCFLNIASENSQLKK